MIFGNPDNFAIYVDEVRHWLIDKEINGIVGIYINSQFFLTNYGLISLYNDFENILKKLDNMPCNQYIFNLSNIEILKFMLLERYPNWCANSNDEWEENLDNWNDIEENINFDLSLESFSKGHAESFHLFGIKSLDDKIKLIFYIKNNLKDFFDFSSLDDSNNFSVIIDFSDYVEIVHKLIFFLNEKGVFINKKQH